MNIQVLKNSTYAEPKDLPQAKSDRASGFDLIATSDPEIIGEKYADIEGHVYWNSIDYIQYKTDLKISIQQFKRLSFGYDSKSKDYDVFLLPRSSISKYNLVLANSVGLIDPDYRGEILVRFKYNFAPSDLKLVQTISPNDLVWKHDPKIVGKVNDKF
jgi:dUTPase